MSDKKEIMSRQEHKPSKTRRVSSGLCKARHKAKIIEYLSNPDNEPATRSYLSVNVLGFSEPSIIYKVWSPEEISDIEDEALTLRRKCYASRLARVDDGLLKRAALGDPAAAKLAFQRYEKWSEKTKQEITWDGPMLKQVLGIFPPEFADRVKAALVEKQKELS